MGFLGDFRGLRRIAEGSACWACWQAGGQKCCYAGQNLLLAEVVQLRSPGALWGVAAQRSACWACWTADGLMVLGP